MFNRNSVRRAPRMALFGVLLMLLPAVAQTPLPVPDTASESPRVESQHTMFAAPYDVAALDHFGFDAALSDDALIAAVGVPGDLGYPLGAGALDIYTRPQNGLDYFVRTRIEPPVDSEGVFGVAVDVAGSGPGTRVAVSAANTTYVYRLNGTHWTQEAAFEGTNGVALTIGGTADDMTLATVNEERSAVLIFRRFSGVWSLEATLTPTEEEAAAAFGEALAVAGTGADATLLVAAGGFNGSIDESGRVFVYRRGTGDWARRGFVDDPTPVMHEGFGHAVALDGSTGQYVIAVGALNDEFDGETTGTVSVFDLTPDGLMFVQQFAAEESVEGDSFGYRVAVRGDTNEAQIAVTAYGWGEPNRGEIYLFHRQGSSLTQTELPPHDFDGLTSVGYAIDIGGSVAIPYVLVTDPNIPYTDAVFIWPAEEVGGAFVLTPGVGSPGNLRYQGYYTPRLGVDIALAETPGGAVMAVASPYGPSPDGTVEIYDKIDGAWQRTASVTDAPYFGFAPERFGQSLALARFHDDLILAVNIWTDYVMFQEKVKLYQRPAADPSAPWQEITTLHLLTSGDVDTPEIVNMLSLAVGGDTLWLAVGAPDHASSGRGILYTYSFDGTTWSSMPPIFGTQFGPTYGQGLGLGVSLLVHDGQPVFAASDKLQQIHIYGLQSGSWVEQSLITPDVDTPISMDEGYGWFGYALELFASGDDVALAVGTPAALRDGTDEPVGAVQVYQRSGTVWTRTARIQPDGLDQYASFGASLAVAGTGEGALLVAGAPNLHTHEAALWDPFLNPFYNTLGAGSVYGFALRGGDWTPFAVLNAPEPAWWSLYGGAVDVIGDADAFTLAAGEPGRGGEPNTDLNTMPEEDYYHYGNGAVHVYDHIALAFDGTDSLAVSEAGGTDSYTLALPTRPTANVDIVVLADAQCTLNDLAAGSALVLTFAPGAWNIPQTVTVTAVDDGDVEGDHSCQIEHSVVSADPGYGSLTVASVEVAITDDDESPVVQPVELLTNGGFETAFASAWKVKNATGDKRACSGKGDGSACAFKFTGGATQAKLMQVIDLSALSLPPLSLLAVGADMNAGTGKALKVKIKTKYPDGSSDTTDVTWTSGGAGYTPFAHTFAQSMADATKLTVTIAGKHTAGKIWLDDVSLTVVAVRDMMLLAPPVPPGFRGTE